MKCKIIVLSIALATQTIISGMDQAKSLLVLKMLYFEIFEKMEEKNGEFKTVYDLSLRGYVVNKYKERSVNVYSYYLTALTNSIKKNGPEATEEAKKILLVYKQKNDSTLFKIDVAIQLVDKHKFTAPHNASEYIKRFKQKTLTDKQLAIAKKHLLPVIIKQKFKEQGIIF